MHNLFPILFFSYMIYYIECLCNSRAISLLPYSLIEVRALPLWLVNSSFFLQEVETNFMCICLKTLRIISLAPSSINLEPLCLYQYASF